VSQSLDNGLQHNFYCFKCTLKTFNFFNKRSLFNDVTFFLILTGFNIVPFRVELNNVLIAMKQTFTKRIPKMQADFPYKANFVVHSMPNPIILSDRSLDRTLPNLKKRVELGFDKLVFDHRVVSANKEKRRQLCNQP